MELFKPAWKTENWKKEQKAIAAVESEADQEVLIMIARTAPLRGVRGAAVRKLAEQIVLVDIATIDNDAYVRIEAVRRVDDQSVLAGIAKNDRDTNVRRIAVEKLADQSVLADVVKNGMDSAVRKAAIARMTDYVLLGKIAFSEKDQDIEVVAANRRHNLIRQITDQSALTDIANRDSDVWARCAAIENLTDQNILTGIATNDCIDNVRNIARVMLSSECVNIVRKSAIEKLDQYDVLVSIIEKELPRFNPYDHPPEELAGDALKRIMCLDIPLIKKKRALDMFFNNEETHKQRAIIRVCVPKTLYNDLGIKVTKKNDYRYATSHVVVETIHYNGLEL